MLMGEGVSFAVLIAEPVAQGEVKATKKKEPTWLA